MTKPAESLFPDIEVISASGEREPTVANLLELYAHPSRFGGEGWQALETLFI